MSGYNPYQAGWSDGYAEGYAAKLLDVTEPFMPTGAPAEIEAAATWLQKKYSAYFSDRHEAIGLVRGVISACRGDQP